MTVTPDERAGRKQLGVLVEQHAWARGWTSQEAQADGYGIHRDVYRRIVKNDGTYRINNPTVDKLVAAGMDRGVLLALRNGHVVDADPELAALVAGVRRMTPEMRQAFITLARMCAACAAIMHGVRGGDL